MVEDREATQAFHDAERSLTVPFRLRTRFSYTLDGRLYRRSMEEVEEIETTEAFHSAQWTRVVDVAGIAYRALHPRRTHSLQTPDHGGARGLRSHQAFRGAQWSLTLPDRDSEPVLLLTKRTPLPPDQRGSRGQRNHAGLFDVQRSLALPNRDSKPVLLHLDGRLYHRTIEEVEDREATLVFHGAKNGF